MSSGKRTASRPPRRYRGHRSNSFQPIDVNELVEIRARQRTFHGAYSRTAIGNLSYSLAVLRLFDRRFHRIGILYAVLAGLLFIISFFRARHSRHDFADCDKEDRSNRPPALQTNGQQGTRVFGRPFVTAGWIVVAVSGLVAAVEICLLVLIFYL